MRLTAVLTLGTVPAAVIFALTAAIALDQNLPVYQPVAAFSGHIKSVGSDTLGHEMGL
jgi:hypothetical protein